MDLFRSQLVVRDSGTREALSAVGIKLSTLTSFDELFGRLRARDVSARWTKIATYKMTEGALPLPIGSFLRESAKDGGVEIVFDWCAQRKYGGITRAAIEELELPAENDLVRGVKYIGDPVALFHPKLLLMGLRTAKGTALRLAIFGSGNTTAGGLKGNTELGVLAVWPDHEDKKHGWREVEQLFSTWAKQAKPLRVADLAALAADADELSGWNEVGVPGAVLLRPYQKDAVSALMEAWKASANSRRAKWRGSLLVLPPAAGKTLCALAAACQIIEADAKGPLVWLSDKPLLAAQAFEEFRRTGFLQRRAIGVLAKGGRVRRSTLSGDWERGADDDGTQDHDLLQRWLARESLAERTIVFTTKGDRRSLSALAEARVGLVIVDEAHHATAPKWDETLTALRPRLVVGLTGTPYRKTPETEETGELLDCFDVGQRDWLECFSNKRKRMLREQVDGSEARKVAYGHSLKAFFSQAFTGTDRPVLSAPSFIPVSVVGAYGALVEVRPVGGSAQRIKFFEDPFTQTRPLAEIVEEPTVVRAALEAIDHDACDRASRASNEERTTIVFARNVTHANMLHDGLLDRGVCPVVVHSEDDRTPEQRHRELQRVRKEPGTVIVCVDMVSEGTDIPSADVLILPRWTASERLFWQMIGRGLRGPANGGTERVDIVTYELAFGGAEEHVDIRGVDDVLLEEFGKHASSAPAKVRISRHRERQDRTIVNARIGRS